MPRMRLSRLKEDLESELSASHPYFSDHNPDKYLGLIEQALKSSSMQLFERNTRMLIARLKGKRLDEIARAEGEGLSAVTVSQILPHAAYCVALYVARNRNLFSQPYVRELEVRIASGEQIFPFPAGTEKVLLEEIRRLKAAMLDNESGYKSTVAGLEDTVAELRKELDAYKFPKRPIHLEELCKRFPYQMDALEQLGIPQKPHNSIVRYGGIRKVWQIADHSADEIMSIRNFGIDGMVYLRFALSKLGIALKGEQVEEFPSPEEFEEMQVIKILSKFEANRLEKNYGISTVKDFRAAVRSGMIPTRYWTDELDRVARFYEIK